MITTEVYTYASSTNKKMLSFSLSIAFIKTYFVLLIS